MPIRFRTRKFFFVTVVAAVTIFAVLALRNIDAPIATVVVSKDKSIELTNETVVLLSQSALTSIDFDAIRPIPAFESHESLVVVGRNASSPDDRVTIIWEVRGQRYPSYTVRLTRSEQGIIASVSANWL